MNDDNKMSISNSTEDLPHDHFQHRSSRSDNRLFPISTYTEQSVSLSASSSLSMPSPSSESKYVLQLIIF